VILTQKLTVTVVPVALTATTAMMLLPREKNSMKNTTINQLSVPVQQSLHWQKLLLCSKTVTGVKYIRKEGWEPTAVALMAMAARKCCQGRKLAFAMAS